MLKFIKITSECLEKYEKNMHISSVSFDIHDQRFGITVEYRDENFIKKGLHFCVSQYDDEFIIRNSFNSFLRNNLSNYEIDVDKIDEKIYSNCDSIFDIAYALRQEKINENLD